MADRMLEQVQFGLETTIFTAVTPTVKMMKVREAVLTPVIPSMVNKALGGTYAPGFIAVRDSTGAEATLKGVATYEQINYLLECAFGAVTPSGAGPYVRAGLASNAALPTLRPLTVVKGDAIDSAVYKMSGGLIKEITLKAEQSDKDTELTYEAKFEGGAITAGTLAALSDLTYTPIVASDFAVYVDAVGGTMGATVVASTVYGFELKLAPNYYFSRYLGNRSPTTAQQRQFDSDANSMKLSMELNATSKVFYDALIASTVAQYQVRAKATNGTNIMQFDFAGFAKEAPEQWQDRDGLKTVDMELFAIYNTALANWFKYSNTSSLAVL